MKSLVEEASTIQKAVEKAWIRAGKPAEFTVKIFEEPKHNFFGMTTRSAKVALFFKNPHSDSHTTESKDSVHTTQKNRDRERKHERPHNNDERPHHRHDRTKMHENRRQQPRHATKYDASLSQPTQQAPQEKADPSQSREAERLPKQAENRRFDSRRNRPTGDRLSATWSNEMADIAQDWIEHMLAMLKKNDALKEVKIVGEFLKFEFKYPILDDQEKEKALFSTWTHLMLATVGNKYKKDLRGLKIILERGE